VTGRFTRGFGGLGRWTASVALFALLALLSTARSDEPAPLDPALLPALEAALAAPEPRDHAGALWDAAILAQGAPDPLIATCQARLRERIEGILLESAEEDPSLDLPDIIALRRLAARLLRMQGDIELARRLIEKIPEDAATVADLLERAQLLDALGENEEAHRIFGLVLEREVDTALRSTVLLRRALLLGPAASAAVTPEGESAMTAAVPAIPLLPAAGGAAVAGTGIGTGTGTGAGAGTRAGTGTGKPSKPPSPLALFAKEPGLDPALANQAAIILALRGEPRAALEVTTIAEGEGSARYRQELRLAEWALAAEERDRAQELAWAAVASANLERDRRYALAVLVEAYRLDGALGELIARFAAADELPPAAQEVWIDLLRETGRVAEALDLFSSAAGDEFTIEMRRELLEMCRETGEEHTLVDAYRELIETEPRFIEWREGLARYHLERGDREAAAAVWRSYLDETPDRRYRMAAAGTLMGIGLDDLAEEFARACAAEGGDARYEALLFLFELHHGGARGDAARGALLELDEAAPPDHAVRKELAGAWERLGETERAVDTLSRLRAARSSEPAPDLDAKLAHLLSAVGREEEALALWLEVWRAADSIPRRRSAEERLMAVAARLGKLARVAVDLERKISAGTADDRDIGLLVRIYTHVKDPVSATEIVEEHWRGAGRKPAEVLAEKARIFIACDDYYHYEETIEELIEVDPEGRADALRQLAMAKLEGGRRDEARAILERLRDEEADTASREFEAGVLALAGLREEALAAYRRSLVENPERIDTWLLVSNLEKELGRHVRSAGMFQHLAETADKDDLFTIAIDGILNLRDGRANAGAPDRLIEWARRIVLERISRSPDRLYLYRLLADLSEELEDAPGAIRALRAALPIAGEQRTPILRELMALAKPGRGRPGVIFATGAPVPEKDADNAEQRLFGRRLLAQGEMVPPQVYLELGEAFLAAREVANATKTFERMSQLPEYAELERQIAEAFEKSRYPREALRVYERILTRAPSDIGLLAKMGELHEQLGRDDTASELHRRGLDLVLERRPARKSVREEDDAEADPFAWRSQNVDEAEQHHERLLDGVIATIAETEIDPLLDRHLAAIEAELAAIDDPTGTGSGRTRPVPVPSPPAPGESSGAAAEPKPDAKPTLAAFPRLAGRVEAYRRLCSALGRAGRLEPLDRGLLAAFPEDDEILAGMVRARVSWGHLAAARKLLDESGRPEKERRELSILAGTAGDGELPGVISLAEASARILPLLVAGEEERVREILRRLELSTAEPADLGRVPMLVSTALYLGDAELVLGLSRHWLNLMIEHSPGSLYGGVDSLLRVSGVILDAARRRSLVEQLVAAVNEAPDKFSGFVSQLPELEKSIGGDLFTPEQVEKLIEKRLEANDQFIYGIPEMFSLLPPAERAPVARRIWPRLPKDQGALFALMLLPELEERIEPALGEFLVASFREGLERAEELRSFSYHVDQLVEEEEIDAAIALRFIAALREKEPQDAGYRAAEALLLLRTGEREGAWRVASEVYRERVRNLAGKADYRLARALSRILEEFHDERGAEFAGMIDEAERATGPDVELAKLRIELVARAKDPVRLRREVEAAVAAFPDEAAFRRQLVGLLSARGELFAAVDAQAELVARAPDDERARRDLVSRWRSLENPIAALAALEAEVEAPAEEPAPKKDRTPPASVELVKRDLDGGDEDAALANFRRLWRSFPMAGEDPRFSMMVVSITGGVVRYGGGSRGRQLWPEDEPSEEERALARAKARAERPRGGLPDLSEPEEPEEDAPPRTAQDVLAEFPAGDAELRRQLRSLHPAELGGPVAGDLFRALARAEAERHGAESALEALLERERRGELGKPEYGLLFALLEIARERSPGELAATLSGLIESVSPTDTGQIRRLARLAAKSGLAERAGTLYRWCAVVDPDRGFRYWDIADDLLGEVIENLEGDERVRAVEAVLALSDPGADAFWGREEYLRLVIDTWVDLLGPERALEKARPSCEQALVLDELPMRSAAHSAAALHAVAGEIDRALACLEVALCELDAPADLRAPWFRSRFDEPGRLVPGSLRKLFPADPALLADALGWYGRLETQIEEWEGAGRLREGVAFSIRALCALRLHELGEIVRAAEILAEIAALAEAGDEADDLLWIADLARATGDAARADAIETRLAEEGRLHLARLPGVIARLRAAEEPERALSLGERAAAYTLGPDLLDELIAAAEAAGEPERAEHWRERKVAAAAAEAELDRRDREP